MSVLELVLAVTLLAAPPDTFDFQEPVAMHRLIAPALKSLAMEWEILDAREVDCLSSAQDFATDLKMLQTRFEELGNAPKAEEVSRFPNREMLNDMLAFNRTYRDSVNNRLDLDMVHADELRAILSETDVLYRVYDAVREARCEYFYVNYRRQALAQLRDLVGLEAFYTGCLPPHVPLWRIPEAR